MENRAIDSRKEQICQRPVAADLTGAWGRGPAAAAARSQDGDLRRADAAEANAAQGNRLTAFDQALDAEVPGFAGDETG
jgi:hypothetical protein